MKYIKKVTQIISYYNEEEFIGECIESLLDQSYNNLEIIAINDGSTDDSEKIVNSFQDSRIIMLKNEKNCGQAYGRNRGLEIATGDYVGFFDADDISDKYRIEKLVNYLNSHEEIIVVGGNYICINEKGKKEATCISKAQDDLHIRAKMLFGNPVACSGSLVRRDILEKYQIRNIETIRVSQDYQFWLQCLQVGKFYNLNEIIFYYRIHNSQTKKLKHKNMYKYEQDMINIFWFAWTSRGLDITREEAAFIFYFLYSRQKLWKSKDIKIGVRIYRKIRTGFNGIPKLEKELIQALYCEKALDRLIVIKQIRTFINILQKYMNNGLWKK